MATATLRLYGATPLVPEDRKLAVITPYVRETAITTLLSYQKSSSVKNLEGYLKIILERKQILL